MRVERTEAVTSGLFESDEMLMRVVEACLL